MDPTHSVGRGPCREFEERSRSRKFVSMAHDACMCDRLKLMIMCQGYKGKEKLEHVGACALTKAQLARHNCQVSERSLTGRPPVSWLLESEMERREVTNAQRSGRLQQMKGDRSGGTHVVARAWWHYSWLV